MTRNSVAYKMQFKPIVLKQLIIECDIRQGILAEATGLSRPTINLAVNRGYIPQQPRDFKTIVERVVKKNTAAMTYLKEKGLNLSDIWKPLGQSLRKVDPVGAHKRADKTKQIRPMAPGNPLNIIINELEVEMISEETKRHFKLFKNPFLNDITDDKDIYMSDEHRYIEAAMDDAARHAGFLAVIGEVQSGKSVMRRRFAIKMNREDSIRIIFPMIVDKERATAASLCDAIVADISSDKPKMKLEAKSRQVHQLLLNRHRQGHRHVMLIEEAHDLSLKVLKLLKRFYEFEDGYSKLLGIILIGQPELKDKLNEGLHPDMREVIRRVQIADIRGLNGNIKEYLGFKFKRMNVDIGHIFTDGAIKSLGNRLTTKDGRTQKTISHAYPGLVNNYAAKAMNMACEMGEAKVTDDIVMAI